jgi:hypothetical protein
MGDLEAVIWMIISRRHWKSCWNTPGKNIPHKGWSQEPLPAQKRMEEAKKRPKIKCLRQFPGREGEQ